jgi:tyrosinase
MIGRRSLLAAGVGAGLALGGGPPAYAATLPRLNWTAFRATPQMAKFVDVVRRMRANPNAADPNSWLYWANVHQAYCPHSQPYFLAWHRGYLALFEAKLQQLAGDAALRLPYWNYYTMSRLPTEFTQGSSTTNPLLASRTGSDVRGALSLDPFAGEVQRFPRGASGAFESLLEGRPHNPVHNLIGGRMVTLQSPQDPIFWLHHANIDRLWSAWAGGGGGRTMPPSTDPYWVGSFNYAAGLTVARARTRETAATFGYVYADERMPTGIPPAAAPSRPPVRIRTGPGLALVGGAVSLGQAQQLRLGAESISVAVPLSAALRARTLSLLDPAARQPGGFGDLEVVLDAATLTTIGARGGFFYKVYLNLPAQAGARPERDHLLGTLGPFEIAAAAHQQGAHGGSLGIGAPPAADLRIPAAEALRRLAPSDLSLLTVSFVRVSSDRPIAGDVIRIGAFRIEATTAPDR